MGNMSKISFFFTVFLLFITAPCYAHFGMVIPSENIGTQQQKTIKLNLSFSHPFALIGMDLTKPAAFSVYSDNTRTDLLATLSETRVMGHQSWQAPYQFKRPGVYQFVMEPTPYWEPAEDVSIIHYTKTIVAAFGDDQGWNQPLNLPTEIVPLTRPFGNYAGNSFTGQVMLQGAPVPSAEVEIEFYNQEGALAAPSDYHITQVVQADRNGVFSFTCPQAGWWGFAALNEADYTIKDPAGLEKNVELGAVLWVYFDHYVKQ